MEAPPEPALFPHGRPSPYLALSAGGQGLRLDPAWSLRPLRSGVLGAPAVYWLPTEPQTQAPGSSSHTSRVLGTSICRVDEMCRGSE